MYFVRELPETSRRYDQGYRYAVVRASTNKECDWYCGSPAAEWMAAELSKYEPYEWHYHE
jgi:hypothetical protein